jgi:hypothetical protein
LPMAAAAMACTRAYGSANCKSSPTRSGSISSLLTSLPAPASGPRSSTRLFSFSSQNWRAKPLVNYKTIVQLIAATTTRIGLTVRCELDQNRYPKGIIVSDAEMATINITRAEFHGDWNYTISPPKIARLFSNNRP